MSLIKSNKELHITCVLWMTNKYTPELTYTTPLLNTHPT